MEKKVDQDTKSLLNMFGLTYEQSQVMFSIEHILVENDLEIEKNSANQMIKNNWLNEWEKSIESYFEGLNNKKDFVFLDINEIIDFLCKDVKKNKNHTWINIVALESLVFVGYTPLGNEKDDKAYKKLKYKQKEATELLFEIFVDNGILGEDNYNALRNTYKKSLSKISGKNILVDVLLIIAFGAIGALTAGLFAPGIAVALMGAQFANLHGIALIAACLAALGGGAVAVGGAGMAGGVAVLVGGGAILGITAGGATDAVRKMMSVSPQFTLTQSAKLETILKEIILAENNDAIFAQKVLEKYREQIKELTQKLGEYTLDKDHDKKEIKAIKETLKYMNNANKDMNLAINTHSDNKGVKNARKKKNS